MLYVYIYIVISSSTLNTFLNYYNLLNWKYSYSMRTTSRKCLVGILNIFLSSLWWWNKFTRAHSYEPMFSCLSPSLYHFVSHGGENHHHIWLTTFFPYHYLSIFLMAEINPRHIAHLSLLRTASTLPCSSCFSLSSCRPMLSFSMSWRCSSSLVCRTPTSSLAALRLRRVMGF